MFTCYTAHGSGVKTNNEKYWWSAINEAINYPCIINTYKCAPNEDAV
jgi:hypothetical protein